MVKVELSYNPYLLETKIKFNGQEPRINSLVEKYQHNILQTWVSKIPSIFYDEMNGYGFELEFSGTVLDCEDVAATFLEAGVDDTQVKIFHKNELDCRYSKVQQIEKLLKWFEDNRNRKFDFESFMEENEELFHNGYNCVVINGFGNEEKLFEEYRVSIENVDDVHELDNTELFHTPLLLCIDDDSVGKLKDNLKYFFSRKDVDQEQLFFMIQSTLNVAGLERTIKDLGVVSPKVIMSLKDDLMKKYLEIYPVTDFIYNAISVLEVNKESISNQLNKENEQSAIANCEIHNRIDELEDILKRLKTAAEKFANRDNFEMSMEMLDAKQCLMDGILNWKGKKTKITKENEAISVSKEFDDTLKILYQNFMQRISNAVTVAQGAIETEFKGWYQQAEFDVNFEPGIHEMMVQEHKPLPAIANELLKLKEERYVTPKEDLFGLLFKSSENKELQPVLEVTYYYQKWRDYAAEILVPMADDIIKEYELVLKNYSLEIAEKYQEHLEQLIKEQTTIKEEVSAQLSDDELKLQMDNDWLVEFQDQLKIIERG